MDDSTPGLGVGFAIEAGGSFETLLQLERAMNTTEAKVVAEAARIERATNTMIGPGATSAITLFGNAATRAEQQATGAFNKIERSGEAMVRRLESQNAAFGKTREELRSLRAEEKALEADRVGNGDLARRIREQEAALYDKEFAAARRASQAAEAAAQEKTQAALAAAAAQEREAQAVREATFAYQKFEAAARAGMAVYREQQALEAATAKEREAQAVREAALAYNLFEAAAKRGAQAHREQEAAAERDAAALANLRAMIDPVGTAQNRLNAELAEARRLMTAAGASADELAAAEDALWARSSRATQQHEAMAGAARKNGFALQTIALQLPDITQGLLTGQPPMTVFIQQGFQIVQVAQMAEGGLRGFGKEVAVLALRFSPFLIALAAAGAGFAAFQRWINQGVTSDQLTRDLGSITGGADATKQELFKLKDAAVSFGSTTEALFSVLGHDIADAFVGDMSKMGKDVKDILDDMASYGRATLAGMYASVAGTRAYLGDLEKGGIIGLAKTALGGDPELLDRTYGEAYRKADKYLGSLGDRVRKEAVRIEREKLADKIGFNAPKVDRNADRLARDAQATEAQIRNLYKLADAYGVSGAAALIAEARVKAESDAIKKRADVEEAVARQVRLSVAQRVADAAKGTATLRDQAMLQEQVNASVAAGNVPAALAGEMLRDRISDLPLLAALEAAKTVNDVAGARAVSKALDEQRAARIRLTDEERTAQMDAAQAAARDRIALLEEEMRLIGKTDAERIRSMAVLKATQEASGRDWTGRQAAEVISLAEKEAELGHQKQLRLDAFNAGLTHQADLLEAIARNAQDAARGMADAFGSAGRALGDMAAIYAIHVADQKRMNNERAAELLIASDIEDADTRRLKERQINEQFAIRNATRQVGLYGDMTAAAKGFFKENSSGYKALETAEKAFRAVEFALSVRSMAQDIIETGSSIANSGARAAADAAAAVAKAIASMPFPLNIAAGAATAAVLASIGIAVGGAFGGGGGAKPEKANDGTGTVFGDSKAQSESIKRSIDALREVDTLTNTYAREMAGSLRSIENQIGGLANVIVRAGDINASAGVSQGFKPNLIGSILGNVPLVGGFLSSLFGSKTDVTGSGLFGGPQTLASILSAGFDADTYSDVKKTKKFFGIKTGTSYSTKYGEADPQLENQFTLLLRSFNDAISAAAGPLGIATGDIEQRLAGFVVNIGKIDLKDLTGEEIEQKLQAVFGATADNMAVAAFPMVQQFQRAGEGAFETLVRVSSTIEQVGSTLDMLGNSATGMSIATKLAIADQFDSVSELTSAAEAYFRAFYSQEEQVAAQRAQMAQVFGSLNLAMPETLAGYRALVDAQDLATASGQSTYATLLQLAPAFADLAEAMTGAKSAADILAERESLQRKLFELNGDTAAIRALDLAKLDVSNRALQQQIWLIEDARKAADAADQLRQAWSSISDSISDEVNRIRGITEEATGGGFAMLQGQFNAATLAARAGDQDAAKSLVGLSQSLLRAAELQATSRQELERVQALTATSLEATLKAVNGMAGASAAGTAETLLAAANATQAANQPVAANDDMAAELRALRAEMAQMRVDAAAGHSAIAANTGRIAKHLDNVTAESGGDAISTRAA